MDSINSRMLVSMKEKVFREIERNIGKIIHCQDTIIYTHVLER